MFRADFPGFTPKIVEHSRHLPTGEYSPFPGICFADTLNLEGQQMELFSEANTERIQRERDAQIMVVIGNPPYNMGQKNENENNCKLRLSSRQSYGLKYGSDNRFQFLSEETEASDLVAGKATASLPLMR